MALSSKGRWTAQGRPDCGSGGALAHAARRQRVRELTQRRAMETRTMRWAFDPAMLPWIGAGKPVPHGRQGWTSLFGADLWRASETKKPAPSLLQAASLVENEVCRFRFRLPVQ